MHGQQRGLNTYWTEDVGLFAGTFRQTHGEPRIVRAWVPRGAEAYWLDAVDREIVSVAALVGTRTSIHLQSSLIMPDIRLTVAFRAGPQLDGAIGEVVDGEERDGRRPPIGTMQAWYYPVDGTVLIWEAFLASFARDTPIGKDANMRRLWLRVEDSLITRFPVATRLVNLLRPLKTVHLTCLLSLVSPFCSQYCKIGKVSVGEHAGRATMVQRRSKNVQRGERGVAASPLEQGTVVLGLTDAGDVNVRIPQRELRAVLGVVASDTPTSALLRAIEVQLGEEGTEQVLQSVLAVIESSTDDGRRGATTGMSPVSDEVAARAAAAVMTRSQVTRDALLHGAVGTTEAAGRLHLTRQGVAERIKRGDLLAIRAGKRYRLPPWQFDVGTEDGVVAGLPQVLRALAASPLAKASWLTRPSPYLDGETPLAALAQGDVATVVAEARAVGAAEW